MTAKNQAKSLVMLQAMVIEVEKSYLEVARALLSEEPLSVQQRAALLDKLARRQSANEKQEALLREAVKLLGGSWPV